MNKKIRIIFNTCLNPKHATLRYITEANAWSNGNITLKRNYIYKDIDI